MESYKGFTLTGLLTRSCLPLRWTITWLNLRCQTMDPLQLFPQIFQQKLAERHLVFYVTLCVFIQIHPLFSCQSLTLTHERGRDDLLGAAVHLYSSRYSTKSKVNHFKFPPRLPRSPENAWRGTRPPCGGRDFLGEKWDVQLLQILTWGDICLLWSQLGQLSAGCSSGGGLWWICVCTCVCGLLTAVEATVRARAAALNKHLHTSNKLPSVLQPSSPLPSYDLVYLKMLEQFFWLVFGGNYVICIWHESVICAWMEEATNSVSCWLHCVQNEDEWRKYRFYFSLVMMWQVVHFTVQILN